jgi:hypothetical protein
VDVCWNGETYYHPSEEPHPTLALIGRW